MAEPVHGIVVAGDISIDWLVVATEAHEADAGGGATRPNWQLHAGTRMVARPGGALLLARMVSAATGEKVLTHQLDELEKIPPEEHIHSIIELAPCACSSAKEDKKNNVHRVRLFRGFCGPTKGSPRLLPVNQDDRKAGIVILDDASNGFRDAVDAWPAAVKTEGSQPIVIYKMSRPLATGSLWEAVRRNHGERLIVVISADDLRESGMQISRQLSWERTATDFVWQLASNPALIGLANCRHLVVRFGIDGAIHHRRDDSGTESRLYYDPAVAEGGFRDGCPGGMLGFNSAFVAAIAARVAGEGLQGVGRGVHDGLLAARRLLREGFGPDANALDYPVDRIFQPDGGQDRRLGEAVIPRPTGIAVGLPSSWCILDDLGNAFLEDVAYDIVIHGKAAALANVPVGRFGHLTTLDRTEIESFRSVRNLMVEYLATKRVARPLSIAVFGQPGSGKSFGVSQVAETTAPGEIQKLEFNVSQFGSPTDLVKALHLVRDAVLGGKVPLVFFDEFDSAFEGGRLGWLKYFLMPMQDGSFRDGEALHPIGQAIFVFAGGTSSTYAEFCTDPSATTDTPSARPGSSPFRDAKGPDFISRLRGYIDILGVNDTTGEDRLYMVRRAVKLRSMLERNAGHLLERNGRCRIDEGVLRALIKTPTYMHGVRSMEAIVEMSMLAGRRSFEQAALPPVGQLSLHVDAEMFSRLVVRDVILGSARETIAKAIHERYREDQKGNKAADDPAMKPWEDLAERLKESNRQQADHMPIKLRAIGCGFTPVTDRPPALIEFGAAEIEKMAEMEHDRWVTERRLDGWTEGPRDPGRKISPHLVPWQDLAEEVKSYDRHAVQGIPTLLAGAGFEIYRLR